MTDSSAENPVLLELIERCLELREDGREIDLDAVCAEHPELRAALAEALDLAPRIASLQSSLADRDPLLGHRLEDRYRLEARLGAGAMGVVYRARDEELERDVAVKVLRTDSLAGDEAIQRFDREAAALAAIRHDSVVTVFDRGVTDHGAPFLVMELLDGAPLHDVLDLCADEAGQRGGPGDLTDTAAIAAALGGELDEGSYVRLVVRWVASLARGLEAAHREGIFHRDVKPSNVFITCGGRAILLDFGIAARETQQTISDRDYPLGTLTYMAPERLQGRQQPVDARVDVYGLGATLYHMLVLRPPFAGPVAEVLVAVQRSEPVPVRKLRAGLPRDLQAIVEQAMAPRPADRYATAEAFCADLEAFLDYQPVQARPLPQTARLWRRARRSPPVRTATAMIAIAVAAFGAFFAYQEHRAYRAEQWIEAWSHLPPGLGRWDVANRYVDDGGYRRGIEELLDRAVDYGDAMPARLYRAVFRFDQRDAAGAEADIRALADEVGTPYARAMADSFARAAVDGAALDLESLPAPQSPADRVIHAMHLLRLGNGPPRDEAIGLLSAPEFERDPTVSELLLPATMVRIVDVLDLHARTGQALALLERTYGLEQLRGRRTAQTAYILGNVLLLQRRYEDAIAPMAEGVALAPTAHGLRAGLGLALLRVGRLDEAADHLGMALELRPADWRAAQSLVLVHLKRGDFAAARDTLALAQFEDSARGAKTRLRLEAEIVLQAALLAYDKEGVEVARPQLEHAKSLFQDAGKTGSFGFLVAYGLSGGDIGTVLDDLLGVLAKNPTDPVRLKALAALLPDTLNEEQVLALRSYFRALASQHTNKKPNPTSDPKK